MTVLDKRHRDPMCGSSVVGQPVSSTLTDNAIRIAVTGAGDHFLREAPPFAH